MLDLHVPYAYSMGVMQQLAGMHALLTDLCSCSTLHCFVQAMLGINRASLLAMGGEGDGALLS